MEVFLGVNRSVRFHHWKFHQIQTLFALDAAFVTINGSLCCQAILTKNKI